MSTIKEYLSELSGRRVTVIGMGVSNIPLIKMLLRAGVEVTVRDRSPRERLAEQAQELESLGARLILGEDYLKDLPEELIFRTPGLSPNTPDIFMAGDLAGAVKEAKAAAQPGDIVVLSPACAAFDRFKNFMERGQVFKQLVKEL